MDSYVYILRQTFNDFFSFYIFKMCLYVSHMSCWSISDLMYKVYDSTRVFYSFIHEYIVIIWLLTR